MPLFRSTRERTYWLAGVAAVLLTWATLYWARKVAEWLRDQGVISGVMWGIFALAAAVVLALVLRRRPGWRELGVLGVFGVAYVLAVYPLMGRPEEALHFVQYGLIAVLFYNALVERRRDLAPWAPGMAAVSPAAGDAPELPDTVKGGAVADVEPTPDHAGRSLLALPGIPPVAAFALTTAAGWTDEGIQYLVPERYYDLRDVAFNASAAALAIAGTVAWRWARRAAERNSAG